jgi:L-fuconolactonase
MAQRIDAHHHLWRYTPQDYGWISPSMQALQRDFLPEDLESELAINGIDGSVVVQARQTLDETRWLLELAHKTPSIRGVVGWVPLADDGLPTILAELGANPMLKGVRHVIQDEPDPNFILRDDFNRGIGALRGTGLVYDILIHEQHLPQAAAFVARHPEQSFVLDHLAKPKVRTHELEPWRTNLKRLATHRNVACKLSGLVTEADWAGWTPKDLHPYLDAAVDAFGLQRLMAGSDWPVCLLASSYERWWSTLFAWAQQFSTQERSEIFGGTAGAVYRLS